MSVLQVVTSENCMLFGKDMEVIKKCSNMILIEL